MILTSCGVVKNGDMVAVQWGGKLNDLKMTNGTRNISVGSIDNEKSFNDFTTLGGKLGRAKLMYGPAISKGSDIISKGIDKIPTN